jgi:uridine kinase
VLCLDDFYRDGTDDRLPLLADLGIVDWDDPRAWDAESALEAVSAICRDGHAEVPVYDIARDRAVRTRRFDVGPARAFVAEGLFAGELAAGCRQRGILADAIVVRRAPWKNFARRFGRDLAERRKPPLTLLRRGQALMRAEREVLTRQIELGCRPGTAAEIRTTLRQL